MSTMTPTTPATPATSQLLGKIAIVTGAAGGFGAGIARAYIQEGAKVVMHYDMDLANNFHFNFAGEKKVILYPPSQTKYLYKVPYSIVSMEQIDMDHPDFEAFPALLKAKGYEVTLKHGDALFIPSKWWHFIKYETPCLSLTLRSLPTSPKKILEVLRSIILFRNYDNLMRKWKGQAWIDHKIKLAIKNTHKNAGIE